MSFVISNTFILEWKNKKGKFFLNKLSSKSGLELTKMFHYTKNSLYENKNTYSNFNFSPLHFIFHAK